MVLEVRFAGPVEEEAASSLECGEFGLVPRSPATVSVRALQDRELQLEQVVKLLEGELRGK